MYHFNLQPSEVLFHLFMYFKNITTPPHHCPATYILFG